MSWDEPLTLPVAPSLETPHVLAVLLRVSSDDSNAAVRLLKDGNLKASPLSMALLEHGICVTSHYIDHQLSVRDIATGQRYSALIPAALAEYLAAFRRGVRVLEDHEFELTLVSDEG